MRLPNAASGEPMPKRIGELFVARGVASETQVRKALETQAGARPHKLLGQILIDSGVVTGEQARTIVPEHDALLLDLIARINSTLDTKALLGTIMRAAEEMMDAEASSLMLLDRETHELQVAVPTGPVMAEVTGVRIPAGKGFCGWVVTNRKPLVVNEVQNDPRFYGDIIDDFHTANLICVPLHNPNGEIIGVLEAINRKGGLSFTDTDLPLFTALADHVAIALERARLYAEELERQRLEQQLTLARQIQQGFLPETMPRYEGVGLAAMNLPAVFVSGD